MRYRLYRAFAHRRIAAAVASAVAAAMPLAALAANTDNYVGPTGSNWNNTNDWIIFGSVFHTIPAAGDTANISLAPTSLFSITYDGNYSGAGALSALTLDSTSANAVTLNQATLGDNLFAGYEYIGYNGIATFNQTAATNTVTGEMYLGLNAASSGTYSLSSTGSLVASQTGNVASSYGFAEMIGSSGSGSFVQSGGSNVCNDWLGIGLNAGSGGVYQLSGGTLTSYIMSVGLNGSGSFNQSNGAVTLTGPWLTIGDGTGTGTYTMGGGILNVTSSVTSGTTTYPAKLDLGETAGGSGTFIQTGGNANLNLLRVGVSGRGYYSLGSSGSLSVIGNLDVGENTGSSGTFVQTGGTLNAGYLNVGVNGTGTFIQSGGTNTLSTWLWLGVNGLPATYSLSSTGSLIVPASPAAVDENITSGGTFIQSGGTNTCSTYVVMAGNYTLSGGMFNTGSLSLSGAFNQSGGTATISGNATVGIGKYALGGGALSANVEVIGQNGAASFNQTGGTHTVGSGPLYLGYNAADQGTYTLSNGSLLATGISTGETFNGGEFIGYQGSGSFTQSGGTHNVSNWLFVGDQAGSNGTYSISGGNLSAPRLSVGLYGNGLFTQSGGTVAVTGDWFTVGDHGGTGTYVLSGGLLTHNAFDATLDVGDFASSVGSFVQSGGTANVTTLSVGIFTAGSYSLSAAGSLNAGGSEIIGAGAAGIGSFVQSGGTNTTPSLELASVPTASGSYTLSGGSLAVTGPAGVSLGAHNGTLGGTAVLTVNPGGTMTVSSGPITVYNTPGTSLTLAGGTINAAALNLSGTPSLFKWTGGTLNFTAPTLIDANFVLGPSITLTPGQTLATSSTLTNNAQITLSGGALGTTGSLINGSGRMSGYGTIGGAGSFVNQSQITQSGGDLVLSNSGTNSNAGNIDLAVGNQLQLVGGNLVNSGTINLNGATVAGTAQLTNNPGGVIAGRGAVTAPFANSGTIALTDGTLNLPAFTNNGSVAPGGITANISGGTIHNAQTIEGFGQVNNNITNAAGGLIAPLGGRLVLNGTVTNAAGGLISASQSNQLDITQGLASNTGLISLTGGTVNTNSAALTNAGTISGYGLLRTGGLANNAQMTLTGGTATVNGPVVNSGRVDVKYATAVFNAPVTNNAGATFKITGGSVAFVGTFTNNGTYASDPADNYFADLTISTTGALQGGAGDRFFISGDFLSRSTQAQAWNTASALVDFQGADAHFLSVTGIDRGATPAGYINNFAIGALSLDAGGSLALGPADAGSALYVHELELAGGLDQLSSIVGNGVNVYYDPSDPANAYLADQSYALSGGGQISPVPEPVSIGLLTWGVVLLRRRRTSARASKMPSQV